MKLFKYILVFTVGAGVGGLVTNQILKNKYSEMAENEIDEVRTYYREKMREVEDKAYKEARKMVELLEENESTEKKDDNVEEDEEETKKDFNKRRKETKRERVDYAAMFKEQSKPGSDPAESEHPEDDDEDEDLQIFTEAESENNLKQRIADDIPYIITQEEFSNEMLFYDKSTITYYSVDDVLVDENEEMISDVDSTVGDTALTSFGEGSNDPDIVYVRNEKISTDFEVIRVFKSYSKDILGIDDSDIINPKTSTHKRRVIDEGI